LGKDNLALFEINYLSAKAGLRQKGGGIKNPYGSEQRLGNDNAFCSGHFGGKRLGALLRHKGLSWDIRL
jgi:hypothetical protein